MFSLIRRGLQFSRHGIQVSNMSTSQSDRVIKLIKDNKVVQDSFDLVNEMEKRKYPVKWIGGFFLLAGSVLSYGLVRDWFTDQASEITSRYLENEVFKQNVVSFVESVISQLAQSEKVQNDVNKLIIYAAQIVYKTSWSN